MDEKIILNDIIRDLNSNINLYQKAIVDGDNIELRQILQQIRNKSESLQYEINKILKLKGYGITIENATEQQINEIKQQF